MGYRVTILHFRAPDPADYSRSRLQALRVGAMYLLWRHRKPSWFRFDPRVRVVNTSSQQERHVPAVDMLIATSVRTADFVWRTALSRGISAVYFIQHYEDYSDPSSEVDRTWRLPMKRIVVSGWLKAIADELGVPTTVVRNGIDLSEFPIGRPIADRPKRVLGLVSNQEWKRTDLLIEVMTKLHVAYSPKYSALRLVPSSRPSSLPPFIAYHHDPSHHELRQLFGNSRVYLCTSDYEGFGLPAAEAMASGTPSSQLGTEEWRILPLTPSCLSRKGTRKPCSS